MLRIIVIKILLLFVPYFYIFIFKAKFLLLQINLYNVFFINLLVLQKKFKLQNNYYIILKNYRLHISSKRKQQIFE